MSAEARVRALEAEYGAELQRLEGLLAIAEMNHKDLQVPSPRLTTSLLTASSASSACILVNTSVLTAQTLQAMKAAAPKRIAAQAALAAPGPGDAARPMRAANTVIVEIHGVSLDRDAFLQV